MHGRGYWRWWRGGGLVEAIWAGGGHTNQPLALACTFHFTHLQPDNDKVVGAVETAVRKLQVRCYQRLLGTDVDGILLI